MTVQAHATLSCRQYTDNVKMVQYKAENRTEVKVMELKAVKILLNWEDRQGYKLLSGGNTVLSSPFGSQNWGRRHFCRIRFVESHMNSLGVNNSARLFIFSKDTD